MAVKDRIVELMNEASNHPEITCPHRNLSSCKGCNYDLGNRCDINGRLYQYIMNNITKADIGDEVYEAVKALKSIRYGGHSCAKCKYKVKTDADGCGTEGCKIARNAVDLIKILVALIEHHCPTMIEPDSKSFKSLLFGEHPIKNTGYVNVKVEDKDEEAQCNEKNHM